MTLPRTVADVLSRHVTFEIESIDRMYLNVYQPRLVHTGGAAGFFVGHRGFSYASSALMAQMTEMFVADLHHFIAAHDVPLVHFAKGQRKDDVLQEYLAGHDGSEGVLFVGRAQEKTTVISSVRRRNPVTGAAYAWLVHANALVNHFYVYCFDENFGPFFLKFCSYFPYTAKLCINGNEWAKRQVGKAGIGFTALDNGFAAVDDPAAVQAICDRLGPEQIDALLRKWLRRLPHPFTRQDIAAGYRYEISILQAEFSLTQMLDRPVSGRIFFEQVLRDNLDIGRPDQIGLVFNRRLVTKGRYKTPGRFNTRVITTGVIPSLHVDYKHNKIKQYHKEGRALRTETTINDTRDFGINKGLNNLPALRRSASPPTDACSASNASAMTRSPEQTRSPRSTTPSTSAASTSPRCASATPAPKLCWQPCSPSGCTRAGSPTVTCAPTSPGSSAPSPTPGPPDAQPTTSAGYAYTASSNASHTPTATRSPTPVCTTRCSSPEYTTGSSEPEPPSSPIPIHPPGHHCEPPPAPTTQRSTASQDKPDWQSETQQPQRNTPSDQQT